MPGLAITDHGTMYGVFQFYHAAKKHGIKPVIGCEVYIVNGDHKEKGKKTKLYHLVLLAKNDLGYKNLIKIVSEACINGFYYKPRISKSYVKQCADGLIALSACLGGEVNNKLLNNQDEEARNAALEYQEIFGEDFYLEIQDHLYPEDRLVNPKIIRLAKSLGIKFVATNDSHYTNKSDANAHDALLCLQTQKYISDFPRMQFSGHEHMKIEAEMLSLFGDHLSQEDLRQAVLESPFEIVNKVEDYEIFKNPATHLPEPTLPDSCSVKDFLRELAYSGAKNKLGEQFDELSNPQNYQQIKERLDYEIGVMNDSGFASYFIVVWDFIRWAREHDIPVGPGRGSAAGSLVAYCLGITNIDPLKYDLLFERFLNPERKSMPDIDTDFCIERREEVINYVREKYGQANVCQIITFNRLTSRAVIKDMARVLEYPYTKAEELAKMIPVVRGKPRSISWMLENHSEFQNKYSKDPEAKQVIDLALKNEGLNKTFGVHAAGVIISDVPITELVPISKNNEGSIITQFAMDECASMGLLKMDFLGLRNLTMIKKSIDIIHENQDSDQTRIDIDRIPLDDTETFKTIASGHLAGIFQLETSGGMRQIARDLAPESLEDISALIALYRPGPLDTGMIDDFIARKSGKQKITYEHPLLESILSNTYGTIVYQEQIMKIVQVLAGFSLGEADLLRRAMGKKKPEVLLPFKDKFIKGCIENSHDVKISLPLAEKLFERMLSFAEYCFNKSHSTAYGFITYQTAYLKTHYPVEYLTALFMSCAGDTDRIKTYIIEAERLNIKVTPPDINISELDFKAVLADRSIVFGLNAIKGVGGGAAKAIIEERNCNGSFKNFYDFCRRVDHKSVNKKTLEALIKCGALDNLEAGRKAMVDNLENFVELAKRSQAEKAHGQTSLFASCDYTFNFSPQYINGESDEYTERELQSMEYELLGLFVNNHPMQALQLLTESLVSHTSKSFENLKDGAKVSFAALITDFNKKITKSKKIIAILNLEDMEGRIEGVLFSNKLTQYEHLLQKTKRVLIQGTLTKHSEGDQSLMIDSLKDLDCMNTIEINIDIKEVPDIFRLFHALKNFTLKPENKGENILLLNLSDHDELRRISLGLTHAISHNEITLKALQSIVEEFQALARR